MQSETGGTRGGRGVRWWVGRIVLGLFAGLLVLVPVTLLLGAKAKADIRAAYPPLGQMVDVGGFSLHLYCEGSGSPTVVLDAGTGGNVLAWAYVQPQIAAQTRVCAYDRAGLGWSEPSPRPRTSEVMVEELHTLLTRAAIPGPYVLVGHSFGGLNARLFEHRYPNEVAGMVLLDATHEQGVVRFPEQYASSYQTFGNVGRLLLDTRLATLLGAMNAIHPLMLDRADLATLSPEAAERYVALNRLSGIEGTLAEFKGLTDSFAQGRVAAMTSLGDKPLAVISHEHCQGCGSSPEVVAQVDKVWKGLQAELATQSSRGRFAIAPGSGHHIPRDRPDLVVEAVREVVQAAG